MKRTSIAWGLVLTGVAVIVYDLVANGEITSETSRSSSSVTTITTDLQISLPLFLLGSALAVLGGVLFLSHQRKRRLES